jgi:hypothetical protein
MNNAPKASMGSYKEYMNKQLIIGALAAAVVIGAGAFCGGIAYAKAKSSLRVNGQFSQFSGNGARGIRAGGMGNVVVGEILSKNASSITVKMQDGSTKIVLISASTQVMKTASGSLGDLSEGANVAVTGLANSDGSVTAQSVQIRPEGAPEFVGGGPKTQQ